MNTSQKATLKTNLIDKIEKVLDNFQTEPTQKVERKSSTFRLTAFPILDHILKATVNENSRKLLIYDTAKL